MADRAAVEKWLHQLTHLPTAPGEEGPVVDWVKRWVGRRDGLRLRSDSGGNLLITQDGRSRQRPLLAVAHMDHPAFVITGVDGDEASFEFRGGVTAPYFENAAVEVVSRPGGATGTVVSYEEKGQTGRILVTSPGPIEPGDIAMWQFAGEGQAAGRFRAPAIDDLAGVAAALAALDRCRRDPDSGHFGVLLTRAEEVGLLGAIHAARSQTIPRDARVISVETSRELIDARPGDGPVIRTGDRSTVFDREMTNRITRSVAAAGLKHQRRLMYGGGCEATVFGAYGYEATGLCICLRNWHNRGNLDEVERGRGEAVPMLEEIDLEDFHGLVDVLVLSVAAVDVEDPIRQRLDAGYESARHYLA